LFQSSSGECRLKQLAEIVKAAQIKLAPEDIAELDADSV
jgi:aryl-alcohol dehydrogenase-like predicted oxidoreductase